MGFTPATPHQPLVLPCPFLPLYRGRAHGRLEQTLFHMVHIHQTCNHLLLYVWCPIWCQLLNRPFAGYGDSESDPDGAHMYGSKPNGMGITGIIPPQGFLPRPRPRGMRPRPPLPLLNPASLVRFRATLMFLPPTSAFSNFNALSTASGSRNSTYAYPFGCLSLLPGMVTLLTVPQLCKSSFMSW